MEHLRIDIVRLIKLMSFSLVKPVLFGLLIDSAWGIFPWVTIVVSVVFIPVSTVLVVRAALHEFDQVIQQVAPENPEDHVF